MTHIDRKEYVGFQFAEIQIDEKDDVNSVPQLLLAEEPTPDFNYEGV